MGYDLYGTWHAQNPDGTFETLDLGEDTDGNDLSELGRSAELFSMFGLARSPFAIPPVRQVEPPAALGVTRSPEAPAQGCVTLTDLLTYDYDSEAWQQKKPFLLSGELPISVSTAWLRERILPRVQELARERPVYFSYVIG